MRFFKALIVINKNIMKHYSTVNVGRRLHVVHEVKRDTEANIPDPNYKNTGMALCGVVDKGEDLDHWRKKHNK